MTVEGWGVWLSKKNIFVFFFSLEAECSVNKLGAKWTGEGLQSRPMSPAPITQAEKIEGFFLRAWLLNAQRSPGFGHKKGIIPKSSKTFFFTLKYQNLFLHFDQKKHPLFATQLYAAGKNLQCFRYDWTMMYHTFITYIIYSRPIIHPTLKRRAKAETVSLRDYLRNSPTL